MGTSTTQMDDELFTQAPEEVTRYFEQKGDRPTFDWRDVAPEEHARTFTVAKTAGFDVLADIRAAVDDAIKNQQSFEEFRSNIEPTLRAKGWWGRRLADDPARGIPIVSQLGSLRRLRTIHWANITTARAAGEWERIQRTKDFLPFLKYTLSVSERRRQEHLGWVDVILPADHVWWQTHYPPNGWLCKCGVRQLTRRQAQRDGYDPELPPPVIETRPWFNSRTGQTVQVPIGIDPGWQTNPGATRSRNVMEFLDSRLQPLDDNRRRIAVADLVGNRAFRNLQEAVIPYNGRDDRSPENLERGRVALPVAVISDRLQELLQTKTRTLSLTNDTAHKQSNKHKDISAEDYAKVQTLLDEGNLFVEDKYPNDLIVQGKVDNEDWHLIIKRTSTSLEIFLKSFYRIRSEQVGAREGRKAIRR